MIFYLDPHPTRCAAFYAIEHLTVATQEAIQVLSDATRLLTEEWRVIDMEKKMHNPAAETTPQSHFAALDRGAPAPAGDLYAPVVQWVVESQDAWDWMLEFATDLVNEQRNFLVRGPHKAHVDATCWLRVNAPRPVNAGRIRPRQLLYPLPEKLPKEFIAPDLSADDVGFTVKQELTVRAFRMLYWSKYRNTVRFTKGRRPWWWDSFDRTLAPALASARPGK